MNDRELDTRLRARYRARASETEPAPLALRLDVAAIPRTATAPRHLLGRGRGTTLLVAAAAAVFLVGGSLAVGSGVLRLRSVVSPPAPSLGPLAIASPDATTPSPSDLARPSASPIAAVGPGYWIRTGSMITPRNGVAVRLADGRVLVAGGYGIDGGPAGTLAELYDPATGTWSATGSMLDPDADFATLLPDGRVLAGDELYDPAAGTWSATGKPAVYLGSSTLLADGRVLLTGFPSQLYDPAHGTWKATATMVTPRYGQTATLLSDGSVLVAGGSSVPADRRIKSAELYDPKTNSWTATTDMPGPGGGMLATPLQDGTVLVVLKGGVAALYDPSTETWTATGKLAETAFYSTLTRLRDGTVLVLGTDIPKKLSTVAEVYDPATGSWTDAASILGSGTSQATLLLDGTVLATGLSGSQLYVPAGVTAPTGLAPVPSPTPTPSPTPEPTPYPPMAGPVPQGARSWTVKVVNKRSVPATFVLAREAADGIGPLCGSVTPNVVPTSTTENVTFELPPKGVECWIYVNPGPGPGGPGFETSNKPMPGYFELTDGEGGPDGGGQNAWVSP